MSDDIWYPGAATEVEVEDTLGFFPGCFLALAIVITIFSLVLALALL